MQFCCQVNLNVMGNPQFKLHVRCAKIKTANVKEILGVTRKFLITIGFENSYTFLCSCTK